MISKLNSSVESQVLFCFTAPYILNHVKIFVRNAYADLICTRVVCV